MIERVESEITPALTAEEWKEWGSIPSGFALFANHTHRAAALALHGQPFGFTWDDVDALRRAGDILHHADYDGLADRIAALLPPR